MPSSLTGPTRLEGQMLAIGRGEVQDLLRHECLERVELEVVRPGEMVRVINVLDMVQPIAAETGTVFPGFLGDTSPVSQRAINRVEGFSVVSAGAFPQLQDTSLTTKNGLIDMAGPGAPICLGSDTVNLVVTYYPKPKHHQPRVRLVCSLP